eukprot:2494902-Amphidinium_carterae.1
MSETTWKRAFCRCRQCTNSKCNKHANPRPSLKFFLQHAAAKGARMLRCSQRLRRWDRNLMMCGTVEEKMRATHVSCTALPLVNQDSLH